MLLSTSTFFKRAMSAENFNKAYREMYDVVIPDLDYFIRQIDCRDGCPVNTDGRGYMMAIHAGHLLEGYKIARGPNPCLHVRHYLRRSLRNLLPSRPRG